MARLRKIVIAIAVITGAALAGYVVWIYFIQSSQNGIEELAETGLLNEELIAPISDSAVTSTAEINRLKKLSDEAIFDYWFAPDGAIIAVTIEGKIRKLSASGRIEKLSEQTIQDLAKIKPSPDGLKIIASFGYPRRETFSIFNIADKSWRLLPAETIAAAWRPNTTAVGGTSSAETALLLSSQNGQTRLVIYDIINKKIREIIKLNLQDADIEWLAKDEVFINERSASDFLSSLWAVNVIRQTIRPIIKEAAGLSIKWLDDGKNALRFSDNQLILMDKNGAIKSTFSFITLPEKCAVNGAAFYCGVSDDFGSVKLPDDYHKNKNLMPDSIYRAAHTKESAPAIFYNSRSEDTPIDVWRPAIKENRLIFINRLDSKIYSLVI